jgi:hypothetical protein
MKLTTLQRWLDAHARHNMNNLRYAFHLVGKHEQRGDLKSYDGQTRTLELQKLRRMVNNNPDTHREVRIEHVPGTQEEFYLYIVEGKCEDRLTLTRASIGFKKADEKGLQQALVAILGDPPNWPRQG